MLDATGEVKTSALATFSISYMDSYTSTYQCWLTSKKLTFISSVQTLDAIKKTYKEQWPIGTDHEREQKKSMQLLCPDDEAKLYKLVI